MIATVNEMLINAFLFALSIFLLYKGSDVLVEGTSKTALRLGVSPLVISLTVVAYGTSSPEFASSVIASLKSHSSFSLGNVVGSCLANLLLVLGISAVIKPISVNLKIVKREVSILSVSTVILLILSIRGKLDLITGFIFLVSFTAYLFFFLNVAKKELKDSNYLEKNIKLKKSIMLIILGLISVVVGAQLLVDSSVYFAMIFGVSEFIIALSMVAIGTSLPELAVSATALFKDKSDISLGNLLGSNIFNIFLILGVCSVISTISVDAKSLYSEFLLLIVTFLLFPIFYTGRKISRVEGSFLIVIYTLYLLFIFWH